MPTNIYKPVDGISTDTNREYLYLSKPGGGMSQLHIGSVLDAGQADTLNRNAGGAMGAINGARDTLKSKYGIDISSLPTINRADLDQSLIRQGKVGGNGMAMYDVGNINDYVNQAPAQLQAEAINTDPAIQGFKNPNANYFAQGQGGNPVQPPSPMLNPNANYFQSGQGGNPTPQQQTQGLQAAQSPQQSPQGQASYPTQALQPGAQGQQVLALQKYLMSQGLLTQAQIDTGPGNYGPQTTAAVAALQAKLGVDNTGGVGYFGPKTLAALQGGAQGPTGPIGGAPNVMGQMGQTGSPSPMGMTGTSSNLPTYTGGGATTQPMAPATGSDAYFQQLMQSMQPTQGENDTQAKIDALTAQQGNINASRDLGIQGVNEQPIATPFLTGESAAITNRAAVQSGALGAQAVPLQQQLAQAQAKRQAAIDISKEALTYSQNKEKAAADSAAADKKAANDLKIAQLNQSPSDIYGTGSVGEYNFAKANGYTGSFAQYQNEDANRKAKVAGAGTAGLTSAQINTTVNQIAGSFDNEPIVKQFNVLNEGYQFAKSLSNTTTNPADDQGLIYAFAKAMDPGSVVREGEYATVQKYAQSLLQSYGSSINQAIAGTGFLSADARKNIKTTIASKYQASKGNYDSLAKQYQKRIDDAKAGKMNGIADYSAAYSTPPASGGSGSNPLGI